MLGGTSQDSGSSSQPIGPFPTGESVTWGQTGRAQAGTPPACKDSNPVRDYTSSGLGEDAEWYHLQEGDLLRAPHLLKGGDPGTGIGQFEGVKDPGAPAEEGPRTGHRLRIREELRARFS